MAARRNYFADMGGPTQTASADLLPGGSPSAAPPVVPPARPVRPKAVTAGVKRGGVKKGRKIGGKGLFGRGMQ